MSNLKRLILISRLAKNKTDIAAKRYSEALAYLQKEQERLKELDGYRDEYNRKLKNIPDGARASKVQMDHYFYQNLNYIINRQKYTIATIKNEVERRRQFWMTYHKHLKSLNNYIDKLKIDQQHALDVREQKELDTLVNDIYSNRGDDGGGREF